MAAAGYASRVNPAATTGNGRIPGLDRLRAAALLFMLVHHFVEWLSKGDARAVLPGWRYFAVTDLAAPAFAVAAGASLHLFVQARRRRGRTGASLHRAVLRRYGLLVPIGMAIGAVVFGSPLSFGVLECLGVATVAGYAVTQTLPPVGVAIAAVAALAADLAVGPLVAGWDHGSLAYRVLRGTFPVAAYTGFVLVGMLGAMALRGRDRPRQALVAGLLLAAASSFMAAGGDVPDRYPAGPAFVVPGLAGTFLVYALVAGWAPRPGNPLDRLARNAAAHTFGLFIGHHAVLVAARAWLPPLPPIVALAAAVALTVLLALAAPRVPLPPWTPRRGWAARPARQRAAAAAFASSSIETCRPSASVATSGIVSRHASSPKSIESW